MMSKKYPGAFACVATPTAYGTMSTSSTHVQILDAMLLRGLAHAFPQCCNGSDPSPLTDPGCATPTSSRQRDPRSCAEGSKCHQPRAVWRFRVVQNSVPALKSLCFCSQRVASDHAYAAAGKNIRTIIALLKNANYLLNRNVGLPAPLSIAATHL